MLSGGRVRAGKDAVSWAKEVEALGAGQILPTSMDTDGTQGGYDIPMTRAIATAVKIPVSASGGAGTLEHLHDAITEARADAVLVASVFHFGKHTIQEAKEYLRGKGIAVKS
jgi:cyclase